MPNNYSSTIKLIQESSSIINNESTTEKITEEKIKKLTFVQIEAFTPKQIPEFTRVSSNLCDLVLQNY